MKTNPSSQIKLMLAAVVLCLALATGAAAPANAAPGATQAVASVAVPAQINGAGICIGAINGSTKAMQVAAFALGFCPTYSFLSSPWGRPVANWVINAGCKVPWIVRAATRGTSWHC